MSGFIIARGSDRNEDHYVDSVQGGKVNGDKGVDGGWVIDDTWGSTRKDQSNTILYLTMVLCPNLLVNSMKAVCQSSLLLSKYIQ